VKAQMAVQPLASRSPGAKPACPSRTPAGLIHDLDWSLSEDFNTDMQWHDSLYFVFVTISTVGFGDIAPTTPFTRIVVVRAGPLGSSPMLLARLTGSSLGS
jgi:hypothetical protein